MDNKLLLKKVKTTRLVKELSQEDMAKRLDISTPTYSRFERGITKTNINLLKDVARILELDFFNSIESDCSNIVNEDFTVYERNSAAIQKQLDELIQLVENQQLANKIILQKLRKMRFKKG